jgi:hypothetical protein
MTAYQTRALSTLANVFGHEEFTLFEAGAAMDTTAGNIRFTLCKLIKSGDLVEVFPQVYKFAN